jgi:hypothetical protein
MKRLLLVAVLLVAAVTVVNSGPAGAALVVMPGVVGAGADADIDASDLTVEPAMASMTCNGAYLLVFACTASVTGKIEACVPVEGSAFGFVSFSAEACAGIGAAGCASGTAALGISELQCYAIAHKEQIDYVTYHRCKPTAYVHDYVVWECHTDFEQVKTEETRSDGCSESHNYVLEDVKETLQNPTNPSVPGWHGEPCAAQTFVVAPWTCVDLDATSYAKADLWDVADEAHSPGCRNLKEASKPPSGFQTPSAGVSGIPAVPSPSDDPVTVLCSAADALCVLLDTDPEEAVCPVVLGLGFAGCPPSIGGVEPVEVVCPGSSQNTSMWDECLPNAQDVLVLVCDAVAEPPEDPTVALECRPDPAALVAMGKAAIVEACEGTRDRVAARAKDLKENAPTPLPGSIHVEPDVDLPVAVSVNCEGRAITTQSQSSWVPVSQLSASDQASLRAALYEGLRSAIDRQDPTLTLDPGFGERSLADQVWSLAYDGVLSGAAQALAQDFYVQIVPGDN